jgi:hypothetical protein
MLLQQLIGLFEDIMWQWEDIEFFGMIKQKFFAPSAQYKHVSLQAKWMPSLTHILYQNAKTG